MGGICCDGVFSTVLGMSGATVVVALQRLVYGRRGCRAVKRLRGVSTGFVVLAGVVELGDRGDSTFAGVGVKGRASGESGVWVSIVGIGSFCSVVSTVVFRVMFLLFGGDCGDSFSTGLIGVGVLCTRYNHLGIN